MKDKYNRKNKLKQKEAVFSFLNNPQDKDARFDSVALILHWWLNKEVIMSILEIFWQEHQTPKMVVCMCNKVSGSSS